MATQLRHEATPARQQRRRLGLVLLVAVALGYQRPTRAESPSEFQLIVNPGNTAQTANRDFVASVFLKKTTRWSDGESARPVDLRQDSATRRSFSSLVLKRSVPSIRSYWQQRIFSGRDLPPPELDTDAEVVAYVLRHPGAVGYVSLAAKLGSAKILTLK